MKAFQNRRVLAALTVSYFAFATASIHAGSATWLANPVDGNWNNAANWTAGGPPNNFGDIATLVASTQTSISLSVDTEVNGITFNSGASAYTIFASPNLVLTIDGSGIVNNSGSVQDFFIAADGFVGPGLVSFANNATAGTSTRFTNNGYLRFGATATADNATIVNEAGPPDLALSGATEFFQMSTAGNASITNNGAESSAAGGGFVSFYGNSNAGSATIVNNGGTTAGAYGGGTVFDDDSTGGTARVKAFGNGRVELGPHNPPGITIGSLEGDGLVAVGSNDLTIGNNNLSTTFSGTIEDGDFGSRGSLTKIGTGTLTLAGANTYRRSTTITSGELKASHDDALGKGDVSLSVAGAILSLQGGATNKYIFDQAIVSVVSGSTINLNYMGTPDVVGFLLVDGVSQPAGVYGGPASGAPHQLPQFTGAGTILVTTPAAFSRKLHGATNFDSNLPFAGATGIECRSGGANNAYQIIVTFAFPITFNSASMSGTGNIANITGNGTATVTINLTGVTNAQTLVVTLFGVNYGVATGDVPMRMSVLIGDTNGNGTVNSTDVSQTKLQSGQAVTSANFREDINANGSINATDVSSVKLKSGTALP